MFSDDARDNNHSSATAIPHFYSFEEEGKSAQLGIRKAAVQFMAQALITVINIKQGIGSENIKAIQWQSDVGSRSETGHLD